MKPILLGFSFFFSSLFGKNEGSRLECFHPHLSLWIKLGQQHVSPDHFTEAHIYSTLEELRAQFKDM